MAVDRVVVVDEQLAEEHLIELAADLGVSDAIGPVAVTGQRQGVIERGKRLLQAALGVLQVLLSSRQALTDAVLLSPQQIDWQGAGVEGLQQPLALVEQLLPAPLLAGPLRQELLVGRREGSPDVPLQLLGLGSIEADGFVVLGD